MNDGGFRLAIVGMLVAVVVMMALWIYRYIQYRRAVRLSQMRWLHYEATKHYEEADATPEWPTLRPIMLSPIPEELGRESMESVGSNRKDVRLKSISMINYGSFESAGP